MDRTGSIPTYVRNVVGFNDGTPVNEIGNGWGAYDLGLHDAYLTLAARNAGYDTLIMGIRDAEVIRARLNIPENEEVMQHQSGCCLAPDCACRGRFLRSLFPGR